MKQGLGLKISADTARVLLEAPKALAAIQSVHGEYRDQLWTQMLVAPDDQLAGFRGMLLALNNMLSVLTRDELQQAIERGKHGRGS